MHFQRLRTRVNHENPPTGTYPSHRFCLWRGHRGILKLNTDYLSVEYLAAVRYFPATIGV